mgnify:CR=1 FL=1
MSPSSVESAGSSGTPIQVSQTTVGLYGQPVKLEPASTQEPVGDEQQEPFTMSIEGTSLLFSSSPSS